jgi:hypothetical protein
MVLLRKDEFYEYQFQRNEFTNSGRFSGALPWRCSGGGQPGQLEIQTSINKAGFLI